MRILCKAPVRSLLVALALLVCVSLAQVAMADSTPTAEMPFRAWLPVIFKSNEPPAPVTVSFQNDANGYTGTTTTYISSYDDPYAPHGHEPTMAVRWQRTQLTDSEAGLIVFDLTSIPVSATIQSATLSLYVVDHTNVNPMSMSAYGVLKPWLPAEANWYSPTLATAWTAPGCSGFNSDRLAQASGTVLLSQPGAWVDIAVGGVAQQWVRNPAANYGLVLKAVGTSTSPSVRYDIASALHAEASLHPRLTITYIVLPQPPPTVVPSTATPTPTRTPSATPTTPAVTTSPTPVWTPTSSWWSTQYSYRRRLTVHASSVDAVSAGYVVSLTLDTAALVNDGKLRPDLSDWRIIAWNGLTWAEIDRDVTADSGGATWFGLLRPIAANAFDDLYYVYYGNSDEDLPPLADRARVYTFFDDFESYDQARWPWPPPPGVEMGGGVITVTAYNASGLPADSCPDANTCMRSRQTFGVGYQVEERARHPDYLYGLKLDADQGFSDDGHTNEAKMRSYNPELFQRVNRNAGTNIVVQCCQQADTNWHIFRVARLDPRRIEFQIDDGPVDASTSNIPLIPLSVHVRAYSEEPFAAARNVVDWIRVRPVVANEPATAWGVEERAQFSAGVWDELSRILR